MVRLRTYSKICFPIAPTTLCVCILPKTSYRFNLYSPFRLQCSPNSCARCGNAEAAVVCYSCSRFYGTGGGKFCLYCFQECHPFYRVKHKWARLENMDQQAYRTSVERNIADIRGLIHVASNWGGELCTQGADTKVGYSSAYHISAQVHQVHLMAETR